MNRRTSTLAQVALAALLVVVAAATVTAQVVPPPDRFPRPDEATLQQTQPPVAQKPTPQTTPSQQAPRPPIEQGSRERRYDQYWAPGTTTNVRFEATVTDQTGTAPPVKKTMSVTIVDGGNASVRSGVTVPVVSATFTPQAQREGPGQPMSSYSYRDMGLSLDVRNVYVDGNYVRATLSVEYNPVDEKIADAPSAGALMPGAPSFASFKQSLALAFENGKSLVVAQSSDPVPARDRKMTLEVKATILR